MRGLAVLPLLPGRGTGWSGEEGWVMRVLGGGALRPAADDGWERLPYRTAVYSDIIPISTHRSTCENPASFRAPRMTSGGTQRSIVSQ